MGLIRDYFLCVLVNGQVQRPKDKPVLNGVRKGSTGIRQRNEGSNNNRKRKAHQDETSPSPGNGIQIVLPEISNKKREGKGSLKYLGNV